MDDSQKNSEKLIWINNNSDDPEPAKKVGEQKKGKIRKLSFTKRYDSNSNKNMICSTKLTFYIVSLVKSSIYRQL